MLSKLQATTLLLHLLSLVSASPYHQKRADICGQAGWDRGNGNSYYDDSGKFATYAACSAKCTADTTCKSFGFSGADGVCMLFKVALSGNFDADSSSGDKYYDRGCIAATGATMTSGAAASTTSSAKATTSSSSKTPTSSTKTTTSSSKATTISKAATSSSAKATTTTSSKAVVATSSSLSSLKASPSSTIKASSSASSATSRTPTSSSAPSVTIPEGCDVPTAISMSTFNWFNSTHNLDCANPNYPADATVCWNADKVCQQGEANCTCTPFCYTGLPSHAYQPLGFGPVDSIAIGMGSTTCYANNGQSIRRYEIGEGHFNCGSAADQIGFYGDSNKDSGNTGSVYWNAYSSCGVARYEGSFPLFCTHDAGKNATCTTNLPVQIPLVSLS